MDTKEKYLEITNRYPVFEWIPGTPIMDQSKNEHTHAIELDDGAKSLHSIETKDYITGYEEEK